MKKKDYRILIVEDNQAMRRILETMLFGLGYENCECVVNGVEAWEKIHEKDVDIILCDLLMPEMDGLELLNLIRGSKEHFNLPFIMVTGVEDKSEFMKTVRAEVDYYIIKPPNVEKLDEMVKYVIRGIRSPSDYEKAMSSGKLCLLNDELDEGLEYFEAAQKVKPDAAQPLFYKGLICEKKDDLKQAESHYKMALVIENNYINALYGLASIYEKKKENRKLLACLNRSSKIAPASFNISLKLGIACAETDSMPEAIVNFKEAWRLARNDKNKLKKLLEAYIAAGLIDEADDLFGRKFQDDDDSKTVFFWNRLALECINSGRYDKAKYLFMSALKLDPQNKKVNYNIANLLYQRRDVESAQAYLNKVVRLYPDFDKANILMERIKKAL